MYRINGQIGTSHFWNCCPYLGCLPVHPDHMIHYTTVEFSSIFLTIRLFKMFNTCESSSEMSIRKYQNICSEVLFSRAKYIYRICRTFRRCLWWPLSICAFDGVEQTDDTVLHVHLLPMIGSAYWTRCHISMLDHGFPYAVTSCAAAQNPHTI